MHLRPGDMTLVNSFEKAFGDVYDKDDCQGVWKLLEKRVSKGISRNVVSLASFNGDFTIVFSLSFHTLYGHHYLMIKITVSRKYEIFFMHRMFY